MPSLAELTDFYPQQDSSNTLPVESVVPDADGVRRVVITKPAPAPDGLPEPTGDGGYFSQPYIPMSDVVGTDKRFLDEPFSAGTKIGNKLFGTGSEERYQTWPEKVIREALTAAHDVGTGQTPQYEVDPVSGEVHTSPQMVQSAQAVSALAGTGGLAGADASLGSSPFLRPALKYEGKIYKAGKTLSEGGEHSDAIPAHLDELFRQQAMSGEDIPNFNFGFMNHKGQFLNREKALDYGINEGLIDPQAAKFGALTSTMMADSSKPGTAIEAMAKTQPFYSALEHNVNQISQAKMTGDQWLGTLANKPGVKPEELQWTGVGEFLKEKGNQPVTKAELQEHLQNNKVELKEVEKGGERPSTHTVSSAGTGSGATPIARFNSRAEAEAELARREANYPNAYHSYSKLPTAESNTKYHSYQLPGGENYREKLLTLPNEWEKFRTAQIANDAKIKDLRQQMHGTSGTNEIRAEISKLQNENQNLQKQIREAPIYKSSHWDEPNILAHVRMNDRTMPNPEYQNIIDKYGSFDNAAKSATKKEWETIEANKNKQSLKSLHIEEIQSDWHQQGRDRGYSPKPLTSAELKEVNTLRDKYHNDPKSLTSEENKRFEELDNRNLNPKFSSSVPDAPFKKTWHELALKRMIREAAEKGYDRLSWTPGEAQAARYDLSKSVSTVVYKDGKLTAVGPSGQHVINDQVVGKDKLADYIGKEATEKLLKQEPHNGAQSLQGEQLKIGGEGMKGFYDQIVPKSVNKLAEKYGVKVQSGKTKEGHIVHYLDLPEKLKNDAMGKGFPLFSSTHIFTPISHDPFEEKKK